MRTHIEVIRNLIAKGLLRSYTLFLRLKYHFSNSVYYNINLSRIKRIHSLSRSLVSKKIKFFLQRGWCCITGKHLHFKSIGVIAKLEGLTLKKYQSTYIDKNDLKQTELNLKRLLLEDNIRKQEFVLHVLRDLTNPTNLKDYKAARRKAKQYNIRPDKSGEISTMPTISLFGLARLYNCSTSTANRIKSHFIKLGWFSFYKNIRRIAMNVLPSAFKSAFADSDKSIFYYKGNVYKIFPSIVQLG